MVFIYKAQLVSDTFNMDELNDIISNVSEYNFVKNCNDYTVVPVCI